MANQGIRGIRQTIPSGYMIGRSSPGSSKGAPGLIPLPPLNQQPVIAGAGGKATQGGGSGVGTVGAAMVSVTAGSGITVTGAPAYVVALTNPVTISLTLNAPLLFVAATAPATPAAGTYVLYMDSADNKLKCKNSAGLVTILGA